MIELVIFYVHVVGFTLGFVKRWQEESLQEGFLALATMALIFFVGWSMASFLVKLAMEPEGFGKWLNRDAVGLLVLTAGEAVFYYFYYRDDRRAAKPTEAGS
jgi:uncharacterized membrane protein YhdT